MIKALGNNDFWSDSQFNTGRTVAAVGGSIAIAGGIVAIVGGIQGRKQGYGGRGVIARQQNQVGLAYNF